MAALHTNQQDWPRHEAAYRKAADALNALFASWPRPRNGERLLEHQSSFLDGARRCFIALNNPAGADRLVEPILCRQRFKSRKRSVPTGTGGSPAPGDCDRRRRRGCVCLHSRQARRERRRRPILKGLAGLFTLFTLPLVAYLFFYTAIGHPRLAWLYRRLDPSGSGLPTG